jgi:hypothetical protein
MMTAVTSHDLLMGVSHYFSADSANDPMCCHAIIASSQAGYSTMREKIHGRWIRLSIFFLFFGITFLWGDRRDAITNSGRFETRRPQSVDRSMDKLQKINKDRSFPVSTLNLSVGLVDYCVGDSYAILKKLIAYNRQTYANKWNYTIFSGNEDVFPAQTFIEPRAWLKAAYFYQLLTSTQTRDIDWFLWVDCDALITRFDLSVDDVLNDLKTTSQHHIVVAEDPHTEFNSGVIFVRNSDWSRDLWGHALQKASNVSVREHTWWEQQALLELYRENIHEEKTRILITPHRWKINAFYTPRRNDFNSSSFVLHRVNCREQPACDVLFESFFCTIMPTTSYPNDIVDCSSANMTPLESTR